MEPAARCAGRNHPRHRPVTALQFERHAAAVWQLGPRAMAELLAEIGREHDCLPDVAARLARYSTTLSREMMLKAGAVMVSRRPRVVPDMSEKASQ